MKRKERLQKKDIHQLFVHMWQFTSRSMGASDVFSLASMRFLLLTLLTSKPCTRLTHTIIPPFFLLLICMLCFQAGGLSSYVDCDDGTKSSYPKKRGSCSIGSCYTSSLPSPPSPILLPACHLYSFNLCGVYLVMDMYTTFNRRPCRRQIHHCGLWTDSKH